MRFRRFFTLHAFTCMLSHAFMGGVGEGVGWGGNGVCVCDRHVGVALLLFFTFTCVHMLSHAVMCAWGDSLCVCGTHMYVAVLVRLVPCSDARCADKRAQSSFSEPKITGLHTCDISTNPTPNGISIKNTFCNSCKWPQNTTAIYTRRTM